MRNESDIFCLKEQKKGDTDGTQIFSANGQHHLPKLRRRGNLHSSSSSFEYGSLSKKNQMKNFNTKEEHSDDFLPKGIEDEMQKLKLEKGDSSRSDDVISRQQFSPEGTKLRPERKVIVGGSNPNSNPTKTTSKLPVLSQEDEKVSVSAIPRNPVTGAGVEIQTHRKSKKGPERQLKWLW
ncbi:uncharacterized protein [Euwallacea fornicatus]|uniref:uncharacterized protein n=1 Tax=Euwallacea fornicatus TaxID=995702 RepID=UPI00338E2A69